jgi:hypothetical protein
MRKIFKLFVYSSLCTVVLLLVSSCATISVDYDSVPKLKENPYAHSGKPLILTVYHPYPDFRSSFPSPIRPLPGYDGWTDSRMERDLQRMQGVGINGVLLSIMPEDLADNIRFERIRRFYELAAVQQPVFQVALMLCGNNELAVDNVAQFVYRKGFADTSSAFKLNGKPVLVFDSQVRLVQKEKMEKENFCYRQIGKNWPSLPGNLIGHPETPDGFTWVQAGDNRGVIVYDAYDSWILPRGNGRNFTNRLRQALLDKSKIICIQSWNNFSDGSFIEPNTLDRNLMMTILQKELSILSK